jgi:hypothetical protein
MRAFRPVPVVRIIQANQVSFWKRRVRATMMPQKTAERATGALWIFVSDDRVMGVVE